MNIALASARGSATINEDWVGATPTIAVVLDGITTPPGMDDTGCSHGTPWLVASIGSVLIALAEQQPELDLAGALRGAIEHTMARHANTCDLDKGATPSAAVAAVRVSGDTLSYLVLSDAVVVIDTRTDIQVVTDLRGQDVTADQRAATFVHPIGSPEHAEARHAMVDAQRSYRNAPDGYWVAASKPDAADHAITGTVLLADLRRAAVLSDGAAALVDYGLTDWKGLLDILQHEGPASLIARIRDAERTDPAGRRWPRFKPSDDASAIFCAF